MVNLHVKRVHSFAEFAGLHSAVNFEASLQNLPLPVIQALLYQFLQQDCRIRIFTDPGVRFRVSFQT